MNNPNAKDNLKPFEKGSDSRRNLKGRPRKLISQALKELKEIGVKETTSDEIKAVYLTLINLPKEDLTILADDKKQSALIEIVATAIMNDKGFDIIERMLDRSIGRAQQSVDVTTKGERITPPIKWGDE
jgi:hypothetical protein